MTNDGEKKIEFHSREEFNSCWNHASGQQVFPSRIRDYLDRLQHEKSPVGVVAIPGEVIDALEKSVALRREYPTLTTKEEVMDALKSGKRVVQMNSNAAKPFAVEKKYMYDMNKVPEGVSYKDIGGFKVICVYVMLDTYRFVVQN